MKRTSESYEVLQLMRGFTLIEILITISIIAILAAILIPNLLFPRQLAHDAGTITCLKELGARQEAVAAESPFEYSPALDPATLSVCDDVTVTVVTVDADAYHYRGLHDLGEHLYEVTVGTPVRRVE